MNKREERKAERKEFHQDLFSKESLFSLFFGLTLVNALYWIFIFIFLNTDIIDFMEIPLSMNYILFSVVCMFVSFLAGWYICAWLNRGMERRTNEKLDKEFEELRNSLSYVNRQLSDIKVEIEMLKTRELK
jgi:uncharacterized membrane protein (DUF485 family)